MATRQAEKGQGTPDKKVTLGWVSLDRAAAYLDLGTDALRKTLERRAKRGPDGATEADLDGVQARKFGRLWRVRFSEPWGLP